MRPNEIGSDDLQISPFHKLPANTMDRCFTPPESFGDCLKSLSYGRASSTPRIASLAMDNLVMSPPFNGHPSKSTLSSSEGFDSFLSISFKHDGSDPSNFPTETNATPLDLRIDSKKKHDPNCSLSSNQPPTTISWNLAVVNAYFQNLLQNHYQQQPISLQQSTTNIDIQETKPYQTESPMLSCYSSEEINTTKMSDGGKEPLIVYDPEPPTAKQRVLEMLQIGDPRIRYVNDGAAIKNPFAVDRKEQLAFLTNRLCYVNEKNQFVCRGCDRKTSRLRPMQQHLLSHSASKFNLCVKCLKGFNDKYDMKRHTRKHTLVRPYRCPECARSFSQRCSLEGHRRKIHRVSFNYTPNQRREVMRVCEICGYTCRDLGGLVKHTESAHSTDPVLPRLRRQLARQFQRQVPYSNTNT